MAAVVKTKGFVVDPLAAMEGANISWSALSACLSPEQVAVATSLREVVNFERASERARERERDRHTDTQTQTDSDKDRGSPSPRRDRSRSRDRDRSPRRSPVSFTQRNVKGARGAGVLMAGGDPREVRPNAIADVSESGAKFYQRIDELDTSQVSMATATSFHTRNCVMPSSVAT
eukprot:757613-Hanusia_phi.AAC.1